MELSSHFREKMKSSKLRMELALKIGKSWYTINRWIKDPNNDELTKPKYTEALSSVSGIPVDEIFSDN